MSEGLTDCPKWYLQFRVFESGCEKVRVADVAVGEFEDGDCLYCSTLTHV